MFCTKCGGEIPDNARFCGHCGAPVKQTNTGNGSSNIHYAWNKTQTGTAGVFSLLAIALFICWRSSMLSLPLHIGRAIPTSLNGLTVDIKSWALFFIGLCASPLFATARTGLCIRKTSNGVSLIKSLCLSLC